jgi:serine/threonine-protein phosphatase PP1 catalytic subunit
MITDLLWSTPSPHSNGWKNPGGRNISYGYGPDVLQNFLDKNDLHLMIKGSQVVNAGHENTCNNRLVSLFTSSDYLGDF